MGAKELDALLQDFGVVGWFPLGVFLINAASCINRSFLFQGNALASYEPRFRCGHEAPYLNLPRNINETDVASRLTRAEICSLGCPGDNWTFEEPTSNTLAAEWRLVCDREWLVNLMEAMFFVGGLSASLFVGYIVDVFGRRRVVLAAATLNALVGLQVWWVPNVYYYIVVRFLLGVGYVGIFSLLTYKSELFSSRHRNVALPLDPAWPLAGLLMPLISYIFPNWRTLLLILYGSNLLVIPAILVSPESPAWLLSKGRHREAFQILQRVAESRGKKLDEKDFFKRIADEGVDEEEETSSMLKNSSEESSKPSSVSSERTSSSNCSAPVLGPLIFACLFWAYSNFCYIGITFSFNNLPGSRLLNFLLLQLSDLPARLIGAVASCFLPRRVAIGVGTLACSVGFGVLAAARVVVGDVDDRMPEFRRIMNALLRGTTMATFRPFQLWLQEAFHTPIRGRCYLFVILVSRATSCLASYLSYFQKRAPLSVESSLAVVGIVGIAAAFIPETRGRPLPQTLDDMRRTWRASRWWRRSRGRNVEETNEQQM